jgi:hypothetical protein
MKKVLFGLLLTVGLAGLCFAAVEVTNGTTRTKTEQITVSGPALSVSGSDVTINTLAETGAKVVTGTLNVTGAVDADAAVFVDGSLYMTTASPAAATGVGLWISQPDGGCSKCYVDAAGTTWACADATCPSGM